MKKIFKIVLIVLLLIIAFFVGVYVESPKQIIHHELESKYKILDGYKKWTDYISTKDASGVHRNPSEITLKRAPIQYGYGVACEDGSLPTYLLYSAYGNSHYGSGFVPSFDGYFWSVRVVDCKDHYFINENSDSDSDKYFGPFFFKDN